MLSYTKQAIDKCAQRVIGGRKKKEEVEAHWSASASDVVTSPAAHLREVAAIGIASLPGQPVPGRAKSIDKGPEASVAKSG